VSALLATHPAPIRQFWRPWGAGGRTDLQTGAAMNEPEFGGPYLQMAVFCDRVLQEKGGVISIIRVVDRLIITATGPDDRSALPLT
jgi:hypothetical protein